MIGIHNKGEKQSKYNEIQKNKGKIIKSNQITTSKITISYINEHYSRYPLQIQIEAKKGKKKIVCKKEMQRQRQKEKENSNSKEKE